MSAPAFYNEHDAFAASWLRAASEAGAIPPGTVDERSITDVKNDDTPTAGQCHFFAGIGGWPLAFRWAGIRDGVDVWSGSPPCQPFSDAGHHRGFGDDRHLWPQMLRHVTKRLPTVVVGEQVASRDGRAWLAVVRADLEALGYRVGAADLCAASIGAPHRRQRIFWGAVRADADRDRLQVLRHPPGDSANVVPWAKAGVVGLSRLGRRPYRDAPDIGRPRVLAVADGIPQRVGRLRGYGNAIVPQLGAIFLSSLLDAALESPPPPEHP